MNKLISIIDSATQSIILAFCAAFVWFQANLTELTAAVLFLCAIVKLYTAVKEAVNK